MCYSNSLLSLLVSALGEDCTGVRWKGPTQLPPDPREDNRVPRWCGECHQSQVNQLVLFIAWNKLGPSGKATALLPRRNQGHMSRSEYLPWACQVLWL